ncbi:MULTISPECIES: L,D-transpeptidase family protein [unclassified Facklamia]|uniref:L,D-transpeptidase family protein n=1 Tax=Aerococcaceae TaxID=186827 RepID=UPI0013BC2D03|nr:MULTISPECIES: L,D-transpeptidase family protein [unclassified Facklamia]NEW63789.1 L,D-transpeptidase family protein [Facklamia sp. 252]NEW67260.1 L,D-transpeptidase family protein [Facklamia sp. 253]QQD65144.1 peptidoglycan binding domain-containing protein [Aerococcaceae bacterium zg-252]
MPKWSKKIWGVMIATTLSVLMIVFYVAGLFYYQNHFVANSTVLGIPIDDQTVVSAGRLVQEKIADTILEIKEKESEKGTIKLSELDISTELNELLTQKLNQQKSSQWVPAFFGIVRNNIEVSPQSLKFSEEKLLLLIQQLQLNDESRPASQSAYINKEENQFSIVPEVYGQQVNPQSLHLAVLKTLNQGQSIVDIANAYIQPKVKQEDEVISQTMEKLKVMENTSITLTFDGNEVIIPKERIQSWLYVDEEGQAQVNREEVEDYIRELNNQYAGLFLPRYFESTYQGTVQVQPGTYGWYIDRTQEPDAIIENIHAGGVVKREPIIGGSGYGMGDSVGGSYVEVDIANQMMFIYRDWELVLSTPVVTGRVGANTVPGAYQVWNKETPSVLTGHNPITNVDYQQPVSYWIAFDDQAQGIHDANWQPTFGGQAYLSNGSLGCVNTPPSIMGQVYELVDYGMPVIIF